MANFKTVSGSAKWIEKALMEGNLRHHHLTIDQPPASGGSDKGPTPIEYFLFSLAGCLIGTARIVAAQKRIEIRDLAIKVSGDVDLDSILGKPTDSQGGLENVKIEAELDCDLTEEEKIAFLHEVDQRCPISNTVQIQTPLEIGVV